MSSLLLLATISTLLPRVPSNISDRVIDLQDRTSSTSWNQDTLPCDMNITHHNSNLNHKSVFQLHDIYHISFESLLSPVNTSYFDILSPRTAYMAYNDTITLRFGYHTPSTYGDVIHRIVFHTNFIGNNQHTIYILNDNEFDVIISPTKDHSTPHSLSNDYVNYHYPLTGLAHAQIVHLNIVLGDSSRFNSKHIHAAHAYPFDINAIKMGSVHFNKDHDEDYHQCIDTLTDEVDSLRCISLLRHELDSPRTLGERVPYQVMRPVKALEKKKTLTSKQATSAAHGKDATVDAYRIYTDSIANTLHSTLKINSTNPTLSADDACNSFLGILSSSSVDLNKAKCNNTYPHLILLSWFMFCMAMTKFIIICIGMHIGACLSLDIAAGTMHTCAWSKSNTVKCWGYNRYGQLGYGDKNNRGDDANEMGDALLEVDLGSGFNVAHIATGYAHTCALSTKNTVKCWGWNLYAQLGNGDTNDRGDDANEMGDDLLEVDLGSGFTVAHITAGSDGYFNCALSTSNTIKCWGWNSHGQLGYGDDTSRGSGSNEMGDSLLEVDLGSGFNVAHITTGYAHTCALSTNNTVKCWGANGKGQLGYGDKNNRGDDANEMGDALLEVDLGSGFNVAHIATGYAHTCALSTNNTVKCWGANGKGQLGYGDKNNRGDDANEMGDDLLEVDLGAGFNVAHITAGRDHTCAVSTHNTVKCWGSSGVGTLGYGTESSKGDDANEMGDDLLEVDLGSGFNVAHIAAGYSHTCALSTTNTVKCFGYNECGELGYGHTNLGYWLAMGDALLEVNLGSGFDVAHITAGQAHTCASSTSNAIKCWGSNRFGKLGYGDNITRGDDANEMGDHLPEVDIGTFPTLSPTLTPSNAPTVSPTTAPTVDPSNAPSTSPTLTPSNAPTQSPTRAPVSPTRYPSASPTEYPSTSPTIISASPTKYPMASIDRRDASTTEEEEEDTPQQLQEKLNIVVFIVIGAVVMCAFGTLCIIIHFR
eukprot:975475_1